ncbi:MAG: WD40 repeat domain-containing protein, partial [Verrucomicrobiota bacterium]
AESLAVRAANGEKAATREKLNAERMASTFLKEQGRRHYLARDYSAAMVYMYEALKLDPQNHMARYVLAAAPRKLNAQSYLPYRGDITSVDFSPDEQFMLVRTENHRASLFDTRRLLPIWSSTFPDVHDVPKQAWLKTSKFSPDSQRVLLYADNGVNLFDLASTRILKRIDFGRAGGGLTLFSPSGKQFIVFADTFRLYRSDDGQRLHELKPEGRAPYRESWFMRRIYSWFWKQGEPEERESLFAGQNSHVQIPLADFNADGSRILTTVPDSGRLHVWDAETGGLIASIQPAGEQIHYARFSRKSNHIVLFTETRDQKSEIEVWDADRNRKTVSLPVRTGPDNQTHYAFSVDNDSIATFDRTTVTGDRIEMTLIDTESGIKTTRIQLAVGANQPGLPDWEVDRSRRWLAVRGARQVYNPRNHSSQYVTLFDLRTGQVRLQREIAAGFTPAPNQVVVVNRNRDLELFDLEREEALQTIESPTDAWPMELKVSPGGHLAVSYDDRTLLWQIADNKARAINRIDFPRQKFKIYYSSQFSFGLLLDNYGAACLTDLRKAPGFVRRYDQLGEIQDADFRATRLNPDRLYSGAVPPYRAHIMTPVISRSGDLLAGHVLTRNGDIDVIIWDLTSNQLKVSIP